MRIAHDESGRAIPVADFDLDTLNQDFDLTQFHPIAAEELSDLNERDLDAAILAFTKMMEWIWQDGPRNPAGLKLRAVCCCWIFLKTIRQEWTLSELARKFGVHKQSLGRQISLWKRQNPELRTSHMRCREPAPHD